MGKKNLLLLFFTLQVAATTLSLADHRNTAAEPVPAQMQAGSWYSYNVAAEPKPPEQESSSYNISAAPGSVAVHTKQESTPSNIITAAEPVPAQQESSSSNIITSAEPVPAEQGRLWSSRSTAAEPAPAKQEWSSYNTAAEPAPEVHLPNLKHKRLVLN